jgi:hypothetical protein
MLFYNHFIKLEIFNNIKHIERRAFCKQHCYFFEDFLFPNNIQSMETLWNRGFQPLFGGTNTIQKLAP